MAISDVLYESAEEIREIMRERPEAYDSIKARLNRLLGSMDRIRAELDTAPSDGEIRQSNRTARS